MKHNLKVGDLVKVTIPAAIVRETGHIAIGLRLPSGQFVMLRPGDPGVHITLVNETVDTSPAAAAAEMPADLRAGV